MTRSIPLFLSQPHACDYLPEETAQTAFLPHLDEMTPALYEQLLQQGFRRSGDMVYRPHCPHCRACVPTRVPVQRFRPSRSQRRIWNKNRDVRIFESEARFEQKHFSLYLKYQHQRHPGGDMASFSEQDYRDFFCRSFADSQFLEFHLDSKLIAIAVTDRMPSSLSAVYTIFDPDFETRSLGSYAILQQIELARLQQRDYLYLGYTIRRCQKMRYKIAYQPIEVFLNDRWITLNPGIELP